MTRANSGVHTKGQRQEAMKQRAAYYEDYAKPVLVNWPFMLAAAAALFIVGHLANRRSGRRLGGDDKNRPPSENSSSGSQRNDGRNDGSLNRRINKQPMSLAELRALRAEAAEARLRHGTTTSSPGGAKPTPLGTILLLARKVDKLEEEASTFLASGKLALPLDSAAEKEHSRLLELLTQVQLEIDGVQTDESVRGHRRIQTKRVQNLVLELEAVDKKGT